MKGCHSLDFIRHCRVIRHAVIAAVNCCINLFVTQYDSGCALWRCYRSPQHRVVCTPDGGKVLNKDEREDV